MEINSQADLSKFMKDEAVIDLMVDAGYQNLSFKLKDIKSIANNVVKYLVIGKCRYCKLGLYREIWMAKKYYLKFVVDFYYCATAHGPLLRYRMGP